MLFYVPEFGLQNSLKLQLQRIYLLLFFTGARPWEAHTHVHTDKNKTNLFLKIPNQIILISSCVAQAGHAVMNFHHSPEG